MNSIFREQATTRLRPDDLLTKAVGGFSQDITRDFWEAEQGAQGITCVGVFAQAIQAQAVVAAESFFSTGAQNQNVQGQTSVVIERFLSTGAQSQLAQAQSTLGVETFSVSSTQVQVVQTQQATGSAGAQAVTGTGASSQSVSVLMANGAEVFIASGDAESSGQQATDIGGLEIFAAGVFTSSVQQALDSGGMEIFAAGVNDSSKQQVTNTGGVESFIASLDMVSFSQSSMGEGEVTAGISAPEVVAPPLSVEQMAGFLGYALQYNDSPRAHGIRGYMDTAQALQRGWAAGKLSISGKSHTMTVQRFSAKGRNSLDEKIARELIELILLEAA